MNLVRRAVLGVQKRFSSTGKESAEVFLQLSNLTRCTVLATSLERAGTSAKRNKGLLGRESLLPGQGLWIVPCEAVHTFWMRFSIDLIYLDRKMRIKKLVSEVPPWRMSACLSAHSVVELPAGTIRNTQTERCDVLEFSEASATGNAPRSA
jgi:uncharacterized membrane protein (UPF0127 family)